MVIAIISLLAAILFPVFQRVRENARRSTCASNLKQIGLAAIQYAQDNDEVMVPYRYNIPGVGGNMAVSWRGSFHPYIKNTQVFVCPSNLQSKLLTDCDGSSTFALPGLPVFRASYGVNSSGPISASAKRLSTVVAPASVLMVGELVTNDPYLRIDTVPSNTSATAPRMFGGHMKTANMLFGDGHVKTMQWSATCQSPFTWESDNTACSATYKTRLQIVDDIWADS